MQHAVELRRPTTGSTRCTGKGANGTGQTLAIVTLAALDPGAPRVLLENIAHIPATGRTLTVDNVDGGPGAPSDTAGSGRDRPGRGAVRWPGARRQRDRLPGAEHRLRLRRRLLRRGQPEHRRARSRPAGWSPRPTCRRRSRPARSRGLRGRVRRGVPGDGGAGPVRLHRLRRRGAYTATDDLGTTNLSVGTSADSPYITAAGGTTLPWTGTLTGPDGTASVTVPQQRTWGWDYLWPPIADGNGESLAAAANRKSSAAAAASARSSPGRPTSRCVSG